MDVNSDLSPRRLAKYVRVWTRDDVQLLRQLAAQRCQVSTIASRLRRRAQIHGISLRGIEP
jgi:hypothetical protein